MSDCVALALRILLGGLHCEKQVPYPEIIFPYVAPLKRTIAKGFFAVSWNVEMWAWHAFCVVYPYEHHPAPPTPFGTAMWVLPPRRRSVYWRE